MLRIDEIGHAEFARHRLTPRVDINPDDLVGADHARRLDHVQPDAAESEHDDVGARFHLGSKQHGADAGSDAATDIANLVERRIAADFCQCDFRHHDVIRKRRRAHVVEDRLAVDRKAAGRVRHQAAPLSRADCLAQGRGACQRQA